MRHILLILTVLCLPGLASAKPADRVVLISVDGWHAALVDGMPSVKILMKAGSSTLKAETPWPAVTVVSHAAMFTGAWPTVNGVTTNVYPQTREGQRTWRPLKVKTVFQALQSQKRATTAIVQKEKLNGLMPYEAVDLYGLSMSMKRVVDNACEELLFPPPKAVDALVFIHLKELDAVGHEKGWLSEEQKAAATLVDEALAEIATCIHQGDEKLHIRSALIITTDHGGHGRTHGDDIPSDRLVPWIVLGPGVPLNRRIRGPVRLMDTAPTILRLLGYDPKKLLPAAEGHTIDEVTR